MIIVVFFSLFVIFTNWVNAAKKIKKSKTIFFLLQRNY
jgi:hypothetical protein